MLAKLNRAHRARLIGGRGRGTSSLADGLLGSLHLSSEHVVVELVEGEGNAVAPGESGGIVITHLATGAFPFIRYRTGDMAVQSLRSGVCGRSLPVLEQVLGCSTDFIRSPASLCTPSRSSVKLEASPVCRSFKFLQAADYAIDLHIAAGVDFTAEAEARTLAGRRRRLGPETPIRITRVAHSAGAIREAPLRGE